VCRVGEAMRRGGFGRRRVPGFDAVAHRQRVVDRLCSAKRNQYARPRGVWPAACPRVLTQLRIASASWIVFAAQSENSMPGGGTPPLPGLVGGLFFVTPGVAGVYRRALCGRSLRPRESRGAPKKGNRRDPKTGNLRGKFHRPIPRRILISGGVLCRGRRTRNYLCREGSRRVVSWRY
jgi:hypothetical protein